MTWKQGTIKLAAAQRIFKQFDIQRKELDGKPVGYTARTHANGEIFDTSLTALCERIVENLVVS